MMPSGSVWVAWLSFAVTWTERSIQKLRAANSIKIVSGSHSEPRAIMPPSNRLRAPAFAACSTTVGAVMSLTGSLGVLGQQIAKGAELGVADLNTAGGVNGCEVKLSLLDDQTSPSVGVDAAKKLVDVQQVPAIVGALSSGVSAARSEEH